MIFDSINNAPRYRALHPLFAQAFDFMRETDLSSLASGRHHIVGEDLFVIIQQVAGRPREEAQLECHRKYIDIQLILDGTDEMGWKSLADCRDPAGDYCEDRDIQFFRDPPASWIATPPEHFCLFFPQDAHAPLVGKGAIRKAVFKVAVHPKA